jgi:hypothetical protein
MNTQNNIFAGKDEQPEEGLWFSLPGLLPPDHRLRVNPVLRTVSLYRNLGDGFKVVLERQFSPNGIRVLLPILSASPHYGSYEEILASLLNLSLEESRKLLQENREVSMRPLRRAIGNIRKRLRQFGLTVHSFRGLGYNLKGT